MHYEYIGALDVTYGNALAAGGGFHRVTTPEGTAAEVTSGTYLWYKLMTHTEPSRSMQPRPTTPKQKESPLRAIMNLHIGPETQETIEFPHQERYGETSGAWIRMEKPIDRHNGLYIWYYVAHWHPPSSPSSSGKNSPIPLKEIRIVRDHADVAPPFECVSIPLKSVVTISNQVETLQSFLCFRRLEKDELNGSQWSIHGQKVGHWIDLYDVVTTSWRVGRITLLNTSECRIEIPTWRSQSREELVPLIPITRTRMAQLGTHTMVPLTPAYPFCRKQGTLWDINMNEIKHVREEFGVHFFEPMDQAKYVTQKLIPLLEKSLLCSFYSQEIAQEWNGFHQKVLKSVVAWTLSQEKNSELMQGMLIILRLILNAISTSTLFFYTKYTSLSTSHVEQFEYTTSPESLVPRHPGRSLYYVENLEVFLHMGGYRMILERLNQSDISLVEVAVYLMLLQNAKPCLRLSVDRDSNGDKRRKSSADREVGDFFKLFLNAVLSRLRHMSHEELRDEDGIIDHIISLLDKLYGDGVVLDEVNVDKDTENQLFAEAWEIFHLDYCKLLISCPFLAQRLSGIGRLCDLLTMAQRKDSVQKKTSLKRVGFASLVSTTSTSEASSTSALTTRWLRTKYIVEWLVTSDIMEVILGDEATCTKYGLREGIHLEVLKRSKPIMECMTQMEAFDDHHITLLWKAAMNQLKSGKKAVLELLLTLCQAMQADLLDIVMVLVTQMDVQDYDELILTFLQRLIATASKSCLDIEAGGSKKSSALSANRSSAIQKDVEVYNKIVGLGLSLLWQAVEFYGADHEETSVATLVEPVFAEALTQVHRLWVVANVHTPSSKQQQQHLHLYLTKCIESIEMGKAVEVSCAVIRKVTDCYGRTRANSSTTTSLARSSFHSSSSQPSMTSGDLLKELHTTYDLVSIIVKEIHRYLNHARKLGISDPALPLSASPDRHKPSSHRSAIQSRLSFLGFIVTSSEVELSYDHVLQVWKCLTGVKSTADERDILNEWLTEVIADPANFITRTYSGKNALSFATTESIFNDLTSKSSHGLSMDIEQLHTSGFAVFERLFRCVNVACKRMSIVADSQRSTKELNVVVESIDLKGLSSLYDIALTAVNEEVSAEAISYLIRLHLSLGSKLVRREVWIDFVKDVMNRLVQSIPAIEVQSRQVRRLLIILNTFLNQSKVGTDPSTVSDTTEQLVVRVQTQDGRVAAPFYYKLRRTTLVGELRDLIARDTDHNASRIRIVNEAKTKLTAQGHDRVTLEKAHVLRNAATTEKKKSYVDAVLLTKAESDTTGHVDRAITIGLGACNSGENDWEAVKMELSNKLNVLQKLLCFGMDLSEESWKVLKLLNDDTVLEKQLRTLNETLSIDGTIKRFPACFDWEALLTSRSPPRLLYQLDLMERFALCSADGNRDEPSNDGDINTWSISFSKLGGRSHLEKFVLAINPHQLTAQGSLTVMCTARVLKLLRHFVLVDAKVAVEDGDEEIFGDSKAMVVQLLHIVSRLQLLEETQQSFVVALDEIKSSSHCVPPGLEDSDNPSGIPREAHLMMRTLSCLAAFALSHGGSTISLLEDVECSENVLIKCLINSRVQHVRKEAGETITALCSSANRDSQDRAQCRKYFLTGLGASKSQIQDSEYYQLFTSLITSKDGTQEVDLQWFDFLSACKTLCQRIKAYSSQNEKIQKRMSNEMSLSEFIQEPGTHQPDALLEALLSTLLALLKHIPPVLGGRLDVPYRGRSLRECIVCALHEEEGILQELFMECCFATSYDGQSTQYFLKQPKCRSESCRKVAFELLRELATDNTEGLRYLFFHMAPHHSLVAPHDPMAASDGSNRSLLSIGKKKTRTKSKENASSRVLERGKYVGLKNLGCTCYLNSTIQALFMIPRFRRQMLRYPSKSDGLIYQLQSVFAHLEGSAKPYFNPKALTAAMKTWEGTSIDVTVQQDASEFLTSFFQQIESEMNGNADGTHSILNSFFGGVFSNELVAEGDRYSERFEPFHLISVPVRDRKNLLESLNGWVEGDKVSYTWESKDGDDVEKITLETHKRISIQKLPDQLIIHLKRFEFDFETMQQLKLHDRFDFPMELDMYPYTKEGQEEHRRRKNSSAEANMSARDDRVHAPEYYQYELTGTVVHMGSAHSGHYYSFLREQESDSSPLQWYEFNDTHVSPFDPSQIPTECFGGEDEAFRVAPSSASIGYGVPSRKKYRSSFMLIYSRVQPKLTSPTPWITGKAAASNKKRYHMADYATAIAFITRLKARARVNLQHLRQHANMLAPKSISDVITMENRIFWRKKYLFNPQCLEFTSQLLRSCMVGLESAGGNAALPTFEPPEVRFEALQLATRFVFGTLWQNGDVAAVLDWKMALSALYQDEVKGSQWLLITLRENESVLLDLLVSNEHTEVRELMAIVLAEAISTMSHVAAAEENSSGKRTKSSPKSKSSLPPSFEFIFILFRLMPSLLTVPSRQHRQYFSVLLDFVLSGHNECVFAVVNSVVGAIVSLLTGLGHTQPLLQHDLRRVKGRTILKSMELDAKILKLLSLLIRCGQPPAIDVNEVQIPSSHADLTANDHEVLLNERFITLLTQRANCYTRETKPLEQIILHLCWESRRVTGMFMDKIIHGIEVEDHDDIRPYFRTLNTLFKLRDSLTHERLHKGMSKVMAVMISQQRYYKATEVSIEMLTRLAKRHGGVVSWLRANEKNCEWMEKWLIGHRGSEGYLQIGRTLLVKENSTSAWATVNIRSDNLIRSIDRTVSKLLPRIRSLLDSSSVLETFYDSDDNPSRLVGKRLSVKWAKEKWYQGFVESFDESTYQHTVVYDDGDKRQYRMSEKVFYVVEKIPHTKQ